LITLQSSLLYAIPGLRHAFFTRDGGVSEGVYASLNGGVGSFDESSRVKENRRRMAECLGVPPAHLLSAHQVHSPDAIVVTESWPDSARPKADAIVTRIEGLAVGVTTADCGPLLFVDPAARVIGAAHAGWKGALTGIVEATIATMEKLGSDRSRILVAIGPMIRQHSYEVGGEFVQRFIENDPRYADFFIPSRRDGHSMFDLPGFIRMRLAEAGLLTVDDTGLDTYSDERFYSYRRSVHRREPDYGRHVHAIALERK
jgi:polyphenol oxidase